MCSGRTTTCCSALALTTLCAALVTVASAQLPGQPNARRGMSPFPGRILWTLDLNNGLTAPPTYRDAVGYFPIEGDRIASYDLAAGKLRWIAPGRPISTPAISDELLFLEQTDQVAALHTSDGSMAWTQPFTGPLVAPLALENGWLIGATRTALYAVRSADGSPAWTQNLTASPRSAPALSGDRVFLSFDDGYVRAFRIESGEMVWERRVGGKPTEILALDERLYVGSTDNYLYCLFTGDGIRDWRFPTGADVLTRAASDDSHVFFVSYDNLLRALNQKSGGQIWKRSLPFRPIWPPVRAADAIVVAGIAGSPRAFFIRDGTPAGDMGIPPGTEIAAPLHVFAAPTSYGPVVLAVTRTLLKGASLTAVSRAIEPPALPVAPLPGIIPMSAPKTTF